MLVLSGDIGATNSRLAIVQVEAKAKKSKNKTIKILSRQNYINAHYSDFAELLQEFLLQHHSYQKKIRHACFGVAGPVIHPGAENAKVELTNLNWTISAQGLRRRFSIPRLTLCNDLAAVAQGLGDLKKREIVQLTPGKIKKLAPQAVLAPGSGIGEAFILYSKFGKIILPTEGGHCTASAITPRQQELIRALSEKWDHVSWERILSGPGLENIYENLAQTPNSGRISAEEIATRVVQNSEATGLLAYEIFFEFLALEAANLALKILAEGGVFIAGGMTPKLLKYLDKEKFQQMYHRKGRMSPFVQKTPVYLVLNTEVGILGAARFAIL